MGYVGNQTTNAFTSMDKQDITGNGGTSYTLSHAVANAQEIEVFVNNVRQEPGVAYTVTGTALTMTGNVESTDDFYVVYQGKAVQTVVPPDGSVTSAKLDTNMAVSGNLAVGTSSAATKLHVAGSGNFAQTFRIEDTSVSGRRLEMSYNSTSPYIWVNNSEPLAFYTGDSERMRIDSGGQVFIGATSNASTESLLVKSRSNGNRAITASGLYASGGSVNIQEWQRSDGTVRAAVQYDDPTGGFIFYSPTGHGVTYSTSSDSRLKENVTYDWDATTRLKQLKPARFNFIADADTTVDGFLAHEAQAVVPEAVTGTHNEVDDDGNPVYQGIDQAKLVPLLVKTIQELEARITALEAN